MRQGASSSPPCCQLMPALPLPLPPVRTHACPALRPAVTHSFIGANASSGAQPFLTQKWWPWRWKGCCS